MSPVGLYNSSAARHAMSLSESNTPALQSDSPYLHPLQNYQVRETHKALIDSDLVTGRKSINQYEVIEEIGRGMHGKVKLARIQETDEHVAIKIIPRFSKKRRLGRVTAPPQDKTKREIAILKKIRHPNVVALLEVIDDPELKKIYMVLEHVELGEIVWRKKGLPHICSYERRRIERGMRGEAPSADEEAYDQMLKRRQAYRDHKRERMAQSNAGPTEYWSFEHGPLDDLAGSMPRSRLPSREDVTATAAAAASAAAAAATDISAPLPISRRSSLALSRSYSHTSSTSGQPGRTDDATDWNEDSVTPGPQHQPSNSFDGAAAAIGSMGEDFGSFRDRAPSNADSIISHMSSIDYHLRAFDPYADDFSYVPCFTFDQARSVFRDTVLGLEYLHYQGVVHRDIKPANLLWSKDHRVKISDFGVSYFGRPIRDGEPEDPVSESEAKDFDDDLELSKTVGTPAFFAPEICYIREGQEQPKVSEQIDIWSLGVTLYCLIFARIPFLAEDEFVMFRKIALEDVFIPRRRLRPVDPSTSPTATSLYKRQSKPPYRDDNDPEYEDVDSSLCDLLRQMLAKHPDNRIRLKDIKRHPWVIQGLADPKAWLEETDPARPTSGRKIQVDEREMSSAVVPLTFLERARSVVKKAVGKVINPLMDRDGSRHRRRAVSSAASSSIGDSMFKLAAPAVPQVHNERHRSLHPDDHPTAGRSEAASLDEGLRPAGLVAAAGAPPHLQPATAAYDPLATVLPRLQEAVIGPSNARLRSGSEDVRGQTRNISSSSTVKYPQSSRGQHGQQFLRLSPHLSGPQTTPGALSQDMPVGLIHQALSQSGMHMHNPSSRSLDRSLFHSRDKRSSPQISVDLSVAPGTIPTTRYHSPQLPAHAQEAAAAAIAAARTRHSHSLSSSPLSGSPISHFCPQVDSQLDLRSHNYAEGRPVTARRVGKAGEEHGHAAGSAIAGPAPRYKTHSQDSLADASAASSQPKQSRWFQDYQEPFSRGDTMASVKTTSSGSIDRLGTPYTSPSEAASPTATIPPARTNPGHMAVFQSDPSLPALLSGASSVSADLEGDLLGGPGELGAHQSLLETVDAMTPTALGKEPAAGLPLAHVLATRERVSPSRPSLKHSWHSDSRRVDDDDEDGDGDGSDDGILLMAKTRRRPPAVSKGPRFEVRRRDTNYSTASDETAKRVATDSSEGMINADAS
ncbi:Serine/threonine-protein kinase ssp1 [Escovopsis weberi]|uniref:non-specific serine/threonine protein kinase n=1 Tax=Escovopsis weberi TaxID=150374 RepID=A0A0M8MVH4_ESCWE|nr:Serine/threonine-protein kinase ssp1 [Escovopsis weberi]